jgi:hypothetical protein
MVIKFELRLTFSFICKNFFKTGGFMSGNLVIVEVSGKAKNDREVFGEGFTSDLQAWGISEISRRRISGLTSGIISHPKYVISPDTKKIVTDLKKRLNDAETVWSHPRRGTVKEKRRVAFAGSVKVGS